MVVYRKKANEEVISLFNAKFDVSTLCREVLERVEIPAKYGTHKCSLRSFKIRKTPYGKEFLETKFRTEKGETISYNVYVTNEFTLDEAIRFSRDLLPHKNIVSYQSLKNVELGEEEKQMKFFVHYQKDPSEIERVFVFGRG